MPYRRLLVLAIIVSLPGIAEAQFTTFIPQRNKAADSAKAAVAQQKAQVDTSIQTQLANMKTWVDSAAGLTPIPAATPTPAAPADSLALRAAQLDSATHRTSIDSATAAARVATAPTAAAAADTSTLRSGARAPATATNLPTMLLLGGLAVLFGAMLIRGAPAPSRVRARQR